MNYRKDLDALVEQGNLRKLPDTLHQGKYIIEEGHRLLNLSSNDYLGLAADEALRNQFMETVREEDFLFSSSSSRLLTGNFEIYCKVEQLLAALYHAESALVFSSGYHMNTGILPAVTDSRTLILADKLVHASLIDGIRLSAARSIRFRHQDYEQLESLISKNQDAYERIIVVTESIFSMDGDTADLTRLVALKKAYPKVWLYVDEAHAFGVRGANGLGLAEEQDCMEAIDFLCGTFGKALASVGAYVVCRKELREYLVNKMRTFIFTTALPPLNMAWTFFLLERLSCWKQRRAHLASLSVRLKNEMMAKGISCISSSHIVPYLIGTSSRAVIKAAELRRKGFYVLPVRPPTVPEGTSRLRFSLRADLTDDELNFLLSGDEVSATGN